MTRPWHLRLFWVALPSLCVYIVILSFVNVSRLFTGDRCLYNRPEDFQGFDNYSGTRDGCYIVPNFVHFVRFRKPVFSFVDAVIVLAAIKNQKPDRIYFHTDQANFFGRHWNVVLSAAEASTIIELNYIPAPDLGYPTDIVMLKVLMKFGGIYLDESYIVRSLNGFRRFEMTVGWQTGENVSKHVIIAHKNARLLRKWLSFYKSYRSVDYQNVLAKTPELVHRVRWRLAETSGISSQIYWDDWSGWVDHYAIHLATETLNPVVFDEFNIRKFPVDFSDMACYVYPYNWTIPVKKKKSLKP